MTSPSPGMELPGFGLEQSWFPGMFLWPTCGSVPVSSVVRGSRDRTTC